MTGNTRHDELTAAQARLLDLLQRGGRLYVAGIAECRTALELDRLRLVELLEDEITEQGGSGVIYLREPGGTP